MACVEVEKEVRSSRIKVVKSLLARKESLISSLNKLNEEISALNNDAHYFRLEYSMERGGTVLVCESEDEGVGLEKRWAV